MLAKLMFNSDDFEKTLRRRRLLAFGLLGVGLTGILCYLFLLHDSDILPDFARGFYVGAACGISLGSVVLLIRSTYLLGHPEARKQARIKETDEREKKIVNDAFRLAGIITFFTSAAALFVVLPFSFAAFYALMGVMILYAVTFFVTDFVLSKRL